MTDVTRDEKRAMLRMMLLIRRFELTMQAVFREKAKGGDFVGALHSYEGQEAVATGVCAALRTDDYVFSTHRGHGHALAKGVDLKKIVAELLGKEAGCCRGRGGSMHLFDVEMGLMGGNGIVGGGLPLALGTAYSAWYRGTDQVTVCFFGEGAASEGSFHESLNMAAIQRWPIVYVCENNLYAATTHVRVNCPLDNVADRSAAHGIPGPVVDGNDVLAVNAAAAQAIGRARAGEGPTLIECKTYRHRAHCMVIPDHRKRNEMDGWAERDPISQFEKRLIDEGIAQSELDRIGDDVDRELERAVAFGKDSPLPDPATAANDVWAT